MKNCNCFNCKLKANLEKLYQEKLEKDSSESMKGIIEQARKTDSNLLCFRDPVMKAEFDRVQTEDFVYEFGITPNEAEGIKGYDKSFDYQH